MLWSDRAVRPTGIILLIAAALLIVNVVAFIAVGDADPFDRGEVDDLLTDIKDSEGVFMLVLGTNLIIDAALAFAAVALLYPLLRDRSRLLALFVLVSIVAASAVFLVADSLNVALLHLARDFADGGAEGVAAGDPAILQVARAVTISANGAQMAAFTTLSLGLAALGAVIVWAPAGAVTPPRWLGYAGLLAGAAAILSWLITLTGAGFIFFIIAGLAQLFLLVTLGLWLIATPEERLASEGAPA